jgi:hypothetical protein
LEKGGFIFPPLKKGPRERLTVQGRGHHGLDIFKPNVLRNVAAGLEDESLRAQAHSLTTSIGGWFEIPVQDMDKAIKFYETVFGFKLSRQRIGR